MNISKYITAFICISLAAIMNLIINVNSFPYALPHEYRIDILDDLEKISFNEINSISQKNNVVFFTLIQEKKSLTEDIVTIYTSSENEKKIWNEHLGLKTGIIKDVTGKKVILKRGNIESLDKTKSQKEKAKIGFLVGKNSDCNSAVNDMRFDLEYDIKGTSARYTFENLISYFILGLAFIILLLLCFVASSYEKKEISLKAIHGDSTFFHYIKISLKDTVFFSIIFWGIYAIQNNYTQILKYYKNTGYLFGAFIIAIWVINIQIITIKSKEILYGHVYTKKIFILFKFLGISAAILCSFLIVVSVSYVPSITEYKKAANFFELHKDYAFLSLTYNPNIDKKMQEDIDYNRKMLSIERNFDKENAHYFQEIIMKDIENMNKKQHIYCNYRALEYIKSVIKEAENVDLESFDAAILFPNSSELKIKNEAEEIEFFSDLIHSYEGYNINSKSIQIIQYTPQTDVMCFSTRYDSKFCFYKSPVICIVSDTYSRDNVNQLSINHFFLRSGTLYKIPEKNDINELFSQKPFNPVLTNAYDQYKIEYKAKKMLLYMFAGIGILIVLFYISVVKIIIQLEYQINAVELAVKRIIGYSIFEKNFNNFFHAFITGLINIVITTVYSIYSERLDTHYAFIIPIMFLIFNFILIYCMIKKIEKQKITKILKGGAL